MQAPAGEAGDFLTAYGTTSVLVVPEKAKNFRTPKCISHMGPFAICEVGFIRGIIRVGFASDDRDTKFCESFRELIESGSVNPLRLPARSPNLNSYAERWVRSVKEECLAKLVLFGESSLRRALQQYLLHYHGERNHQGKENLILFPLKREGARDRKAAVRCRERLGGLLKYYEREAA